MAVVHAPRVLYPSSLAGAGMGVMNGGSLLFNLEVEEEPPAYGASASTLETRLSSVRSLVATRFTQQQSEELQLVFDVRRMTAALRAEAPDGKLDVNDLAARLSAVGYSVTVRNALGGGPACFRNLRHQFLTVLARNSDGSSSSLVLPPPQQQQQQAGSMMVSAGGLGVDANSTSASAGRAALLPAAAAMAPASSMQYVVDPHFKQQFEVSQPSAAYAAALELVPPEFVGTCSRLVPLVHALCAEMAASFEAMGLTLPPWRRASAMLSKWQPSRCHDVCVSASGCGANGECAAAAASGSSGSSTPAGSPTGADAAAAEGSSPFSRIDDCQILLRQGSGRSLLSGKLNGGGGGPAGSSMSGTSSSAACVGAGGGAAAARTHSVPCFSRTSSGCSCASITSMQGTSSDLHLQQRRQQAAQLAAAAQQHVTGTVSRQPPVYRGLPATYTVKRGGPAYTPQPPQ